MVADALLSMKAVVMQVALLIACSEATKEDHGEEGAEDCWGECSALSCWSLLSTLST